MDAGFVRLRGLVDALSMKCAGLAGSKWAAEHVPNMRIATFD